MKKLTFRGIMIAAAVSTGLLTLFAGLGYAFSRIGWLMDTAITFGTTFYHFAMRLAVGYLIPNRFVHSRRWFQPKAFETPLHELLRIKKWKGRMPTFDHRQFSLSENALEDIVRNMCRAEVVHEVIIPLSFVPVLLSLLWHNFFLFFITSVLAAAVDAVFTLMQRYNRPRLVRLINKQNSRRITL